MSQRGPRTTRTPRMVHLLIPFMRGADLATAERAANVLKARAPAQEADALGALLAVFLSRFQGAGAA